MQPAQDGLRVQPISGGLLEAPRFRESPALKFCAGTLADKPHQVGKPLFGPLVGCHGARRAAYRIVYRVDDGQRVVRILDVGHRQDIYRPR